MLVRIDVIIIPRYGDIGDTLVLVFAEQGFHGNGPQAVRVQEGNTDLRDEYLVCRSLISPS